MTDNADLDLIKDTGDPVLDAAFDLAGAQVRAALAKQQGDADTVKVAQRASLAAGWFSRR